jgi:hypothetical protein
MRRTLEGGTGGSNGRLIRTLCRKGVGRAVHAPTAQRLFLRLGCGWGHAGLVRWEQRFASPIRRTARVGPAHVVFSTRRCSAPIDDLRRTTMLAMIKYNRELFWIIQI